MKDGKYSICVIDDSTVDTFLIKTVLKGVNSIGNISSFVDPEEALLHVIKMNNLGRHYPDLILLDINMPILTGFEWIDEIDQIFDDDFIPEIFFLSHSNMRKDLESMEKQTRASVLMKKPLKKDVFLKHFNEHFEIV